MFYARSVVRDRREDALSSAQDLAECRAHLMEMRSQGLNAAPTAPVNNAELAAGINQRLREAAVAAGAGDKLTSIEPGNTETVGHSTELSVFLHLEPVTMRELVTFLHR